MTASGDDAREGFAGVIIIPGKGGMVETEIEDGVLRARRIVHKLAGLLSGISAGLYCAKIGKEPEAVARCVTDVQELLDEAGAELAELRLILREMDAPAALGPE